MYNLAEIYENGNGVPEDKKITLKWYKKSAKAGCEEAEGKVKEFKSCSITKTHEQLDFFIENEENITENKESIVRYIATLKDNTDSENKSAYLFLEALCYWFAYIGDDDSYYVNGIDAINEAICLDKSCFDFRLLRVCLIKAHEFYSVDTDALFHDWIDKERACLLQYNKDTAYLKYDFYERGFTDELYILCDEEHQYETIDQSAESNLMLKIEQEYIEEVKACLYETNEVSLRERRLLEKLRRKLNINENRAKELEESIQILPITDNEQEYLDEYYAYLENDGSISGKERRLLDKLRIVLNISEKRSVELEINNK